MVEVLVTMVVIAVGLMGHAKLLTRTINHNNSSYFRSLATVMAYNIADCMRANATAAVAGSYNIGIGSAATGGSVAGDDLVSWKTQLSSLLPDGDGSVSVNGGGATTVTIRWDERESIPSSDSGCASTPTDPTPYRCFSMQTDIKG